MPLQLEDLDLSQVAFELRFANAFVMWDRAGKIWQEVCRILPGSTVVNAAPNKIFMRDGPIEITAEPNRLGVVLYERERLKSMPHVVSELAEVVSSILELESFTRMGLRVIYWKVFPKRENAAAEVMKLGLLKIPEGPHFGVQGSNLNPEIAFRREEGGKGFSLRIKAEAIEFKLEIPYLWQDVVKSTTEVRETFSFDVDAYLHGTILRSKVAFEDWITQTMHVIRRDSGDFLGLWG